MLPDRFTATNPFLPLLETHATPSSLTEAYTQHRSKRLATQRETLLAPSFTGLTPDAILRQVLSVNESCDSRHNLPVWARPTPGVKKLVDRIQGRLKRDLASAWDDVIWYMPIERLHMTVIEFAHSKNESEIDDVVRALRDKGILDALTDFPSDAASAEDYAESRANGRNAGGESRVEVEGAAAAAAAAATAAPTPRNTWRGKRRKARLVRPVIGFDASALALTYVPDPSDGWTYHHLRAEMWELGSTAVQIASRYVVPSAHLTLCRFIEKDGVDVRKLVSIVGRLNEWLENEMWEMEEQQRKEEGFVWDVGEGTGLDLRAGTCWYGGGYSVRVGKGF